MYSGFGTFFESNFETEKARNILASIARLGLTVPQPSSLRGSLKFNTPDNELCYNQVDLLSPKLLDETINSLVYDEKEGFWAIACERHFQEEILPAYQVSEALVNSVVFLFSRKNKIYHQSNSEVQVNQWPNLRLLGTAIGEEDEAYFKEVRVPGVKYSVQLSEMNAILAPLHLVPFVKEFFGGILVIPVALLEGKLTENPIELDMQGKCVKNQRILGPNYVRALQIALAEFPELEQFGVHLTRLSNVYQPDLRLSLEKNHELYKRKWDTITLRLSNPNSEQLEQIKELPGVLVVKESRNKRNTYFCLCAQAQKETIAELIEPVPSLNERRVPN